MIWKKILYIFFLLALLAAVSAVSLHYGFRLQADKESDNLAFVQGTLAFNEYTEYREIERLIEQKCYEQARNRVMFDKDTQLQLLENNRQRKDPRLERYVEKREPDLLKRMTLEGSAVSKEMVIVPCSASGK
jgi:hypothetical protein